MALIFTDINTHFETWTKDF